MTQEIDKKPKKILGNSSYKNSKQKQKLKQKKVIEVKKIISKDRQVKIKIKHLAKELERIAKAVEIGKIDNQKATSEKESIKNKIHKLKIIDQKFTKKPTSKTN